MSSCTILEKVDFFLQYIFHAVKDAVIVYSDISKCFTQQGSVMLYFMLDVH